MRCLQAQEKFILVWCSEVQNTPTAPGVSQRVRWEQKQQTDNFPQQAKQSKCLCGNATLLAAGFAALKLALNACRKKALSGRARLTEKVASVSSWACPALLWLLHLG